ncbi:MAG: efflux RND transporter periplasmic adaptor subunit [Gammaproteobacteria bacterium]|nr:efflux RND transporter periplasmic adaptor subunit [Gammaproteobacteria bacterium]
MSRCFFTNHRLPYAETTTSKKRLAIGAVLTLTLAITACGQQGDAADGHGGNPGGMPAMPVTVIEAKSQSVPVVIEEVGQVEGSKDVEVRARVSGFLTHQRYTEGERVKKGAVLFDIDREPFENALEQAKAALEQSKANLDKAKREVNRLTPLLKAKAVSEKELDDAKTTLQSAEAEKLSAEARVRNAELDLSYTEVVAPITGVTDRAQYSEGTLVGSGAASSLLTTMHIIDPVWVRFAFSEIEARQLRQADGKAIVKLMLAGDRPYALNGKLNYTASTVSTQTGMVSMRATFPNPESLLLPGQFVRVLVTIGERKAFLVPQAALAQTGQGQMVFTAGPDDTVTPKPVKTDGWLGNDWVVTEGLNDGDRIITDNLMKLRPGAPVKPHAPGEMPGKPDAKAAKTA